MPQLIFFAGKHTAGCEDVLAAGSPYRSGDASPVQTVSERLYDRRGSTSEGAVGNLVKTDEINPAFKPLQEHHEGVGVPFTIVHSGKHRVFEAHAALAGEIVLLYKIHDIFYIVPSLDWHKLSPLLRKRSVYADCKMASGLIQKLFQIGYNTYG